MDDMDWWKKGSIYQIYPRSFSDATGRGWGDLNGIRQKLPYVASLGVDAVWISPFFKSPMKDFGYDVVDHRSVDPMFGSDADLDALITEARELGLKVMVDLVLSHVSDQHPWFVDASKNKDSEYSDCFVWAEAKPDGTPPNNWLSIFGGSAWTWHSTRRQYYLHNFLRSQPDLNYHNPMVRDEALSIAKHWLDRGVSGFRLDTVNFYFHDQELRSNPPSPYGGEAIALEGNPYSYQDHIYDKNQPENLDFLAQLGALMAQYPGTITLGEVGAVQKRSWHLIGQYTDGQRLNLCYTFDLLGERYSAEYIKSVVERSLREAPNAWPCWALSNHDVPRSASRVAKGWANTDDVAALNAGLLLSLRGTPCIYQGEELGLTDADVPYELLQDPYGIEFWPDYTGRDGCRTPMPWNREKPGCGFTESTTPWLPIGDEHRTKAVSEQEEVIDSSLNVFRRIMAARRQEIALQLGDLTMVDAPDGVLAFSRTHGAETVYCYFNLSGHPQRLPTSSAGPHRFFNGTTTDWRPVSSHIELGPRAWVGSRPLEFIRNRETSRMMGPIAPSRLSLVL